MGEQPANQLTQYFGDIMQSLFANSKRDDFEGTGSDLLQSSYVAMTSMVQHSCSQSNDVTYQLMIPVL